MEKNQNLFDQAESIYRKEIYEWALKYAKKGWMIFPLHSISFAGQCTCGKPSCGDAGKHPRVLRGVRDASSDLKKIESWFGEGSPLSNIGVSTGVDSGITVIDIDIGQGKLGAESWQEAIKDHGEPETLMAETGGGGMHIVFLYNSALKTAGNVLGKGVDCRNDGGYIVAAPSFHRSGGYYKWIDWTTEIAPLPAHLSKRKETRGRPRKDDVYRGKYSLKQAKTMLEFIPSSDRDLWRHIGIILGREFQRSDDAWDVYCEWAAKDAGKKGRGHDEIMKESFYDLSQQQSESQLSIGTIVKAALEGGWAPASGEVPIGNFVFYGPGNNYIYRPTNSLWISGAVDAAVSPVNVDGKLQRASEWLKVNQLCTSMTCDPAIEDDYLKGYDCRNGETVEIAGAAMYNAYRKPTIELGDSRLAQPFLSHVLRVFPREGDANAFLDYMAHRVQKPWEKPRFALLIAGGQGVGKDTAVEFCCPAIGVWNVANIDPSAFESAFNEFGSATLVRINEAANLHDMSRWAFNERTKVLIAGSPDVCQINPKYGQKYFVRMHCGVIITTNHLTSSIYIPPDDRRYDVIAAAEMAEMGLEDELVRRNYFSELWDWYLSGGDAHVAAYLHDRDISGFSPNNGQRKTEAHRTVVVGGMAGDQWLDDILDELDWPVGVRGDWIASRAVERGEKDGDVKRKLGNTIGRMGYTLFKNHATKDGRWRICGKKTVVYVKVGTPSDFDPLAELSKEAF